MVLFVFSDSACFSSLGSLDTLEKTWMNVKSKVPSKSSPWRVKNPIGCTLW